MGARQSFSLESLAEDSHAATTRKTKATLTLTPDADSDYWLIASGAFSSASTTDDHVGHVAVHHVNAGLDLLLQSGQNKERTSPADWIALFGIAKVSFDASPGEQTIDVTFWSSHDGDITKVRDLRLLLIKADPADQYAASDAPSSTTLQTYQTKTTLSFTPASAGDYLLIAGATVATDINLTAMRARLNHVGGASYGDRTWWSKDDWDNQPFAVMEKLPLPASAQTFHMQYRSNSGTLSYIRHARILGLRLDAFDNVYFASNHATQNTTSASNVDFLTLSATPLALSHAIIAVGGNQVASSNVSGYASIARDGVTTQEWVREAPNGTGWQFPGLVQRQTLAAVHTSWTWRARAEIAGTTVNVGDLSIAILQLEATPAPVRRRYMAVAG